jgi:glucokinase
MHAPAGRRFAKARDGREITLMLLVGDIGGTKTLLALFSPGADPRAPVAQREYHSAGYPGLSDVARSFLAETGQQAEFGCFDVAGPVIGGRARITNLPWMMDEQELARDIGLRRVTLLNDLKAVAYAIPGLLPSDLLTLNAGEVEPHGQIAIIAPGTGLGEAFLVWSGTAYIACQSEGGHASFAPTNERQVALLRYLSARFGEVSFERVCSGIGIANLYDFLRDTQAYPETPDFAARLAQAGDRTPLISQAGLQDRSGNPLAAAALDLFTEILGSEAGNLALKVLATGGVYLAGGIPPRILPLLGAPGFLAAFADKGRLGADLRRMPVHVVTVQAALFGAARYALDTLP